MPASSDFRFLQAAAVVLLLFAAAHEAAVRWPGQPLPAVSQTAAEAPADSVAVGAQPSAELARPAAVLPTQAPEHQEATETVSADTLECPPQPLRFSRLKTGPVFHRYTGTIGGERVTAELAWTRPDTITGRFYRWRGGPEHQLSYRGRRQGPFRLSVRYVDDSRQREQDFGTWHLVGAPGLALRGIWLDSAGRRQSFALREDYRQGVRYDVQTLTVSGGDCNAASLTRDYLHLRSPLRPAWRRLQAPGPAARKRRLLAEYERYGDTSYHLTVRLNDFNLLSYENFYALFHSGGPRQDGLESGLFDLATGRPLTLASQLRPGYEPTLRRLLTDRLRRDFDKAPATPDQSAKPRRLLELPTSDNITFSSLALTGAGLEGSYLPHEIQAVLGPETDVYSIPYPILIPYRELRPLVRPNTPLARMLAARNIW